MKQTLQRLPIGIQNFESLRQDGYLYVDKTEYIYELIDNENDQLQVSDPLTRISSKDLDYHVFGLSNTSAAVVYESMDEEKMWIEIIEVPTEHT